MKPWKILLTALALYAFSGCSTEGSDHTTDPGGFFPGIYVPDQLDVIYDPLYKEGVLEVHHGSWSGSGNDVLSERMYAYGDFHNSATDDSRRWVASHEVQWKKLRELDSRKNFGYYYVGINDIEITANVKIGGIEPGSDLSHLFEIVSFGVDGRRVFKYPSCDLAFEDADYYPQTIREFCSVNPLYVEYFALKPVFDVNEEDTDILEFSVRIMAEDEFLGDRVLNGVSRIDLSFMRACDLSYPMKPST